MESETQNPLDDLQFFPASIRLIDGTFVHCNYAEDEEGWCYMDSPLVPFRVSEQDPETGESVYKLAYDRYDPFTDERIILISEQYVMTVTVLSDEMETLYTKALDTFQGVESEDDIQVPTELPSGAPTLH